MKVLVGYVGGAALAVVGASGAQQIGGVAGVVVAGTAILVSSAWVVWWIVKQFPDARL
jgi:hypothetical protein